MFSPELGRRLWAIGRKELGFFIGKDAEGKPRLTLPPELLSFIDKIDPGNYRPGSLFAYVAILMSAREFGDDELAEAAQRSMDQDCGLSRNGVACYTKGSNLANIWGVEGGLMRTGDFRKSFVVGPPQSVFERTDPRRRALSGCARRQGVQSRRTISSSCSIPELERERGRSGSSG